MNSVNLDMVMQVHCLVNVQSERLSERCANRNSASHRQLRHAGRCSGIALRRAPTLGNFVLRRRAYAYPRRLGAGDNQLVATEHERCT